MRNKDLLFGPPLATDERVVTHAGMTRNQQTLSIVGAIFGAMALYIGYDALTNPNLDGLSPPQKCEYWAYFHNHGGSVDKCQQSEAEAAAARIRAAAGAPEDQQTEQDFLNQPAPADTEADVPPTKL